MAPFTFQFFYYDPSLAAAVLFVLLFGFSLIVHVWQLVKSRTWYFIPFVIGGLFETIGYVGRALAAKQAPNFTKTPYVIQSLLILLAPAFFAASIYMILARLIRMVHGEAQSLISTKWMTTIFVTGDVLSFLAQGAGGGILATAKTMDQVQTGNQIIVGGLAIQVVFFGCFIITTAVFHWRFLRAPLSCTGNARTRIRYVWVLYATSILILVRNLVRIVEYSQGFDGPLQRQEVYIYVFDALPMLIVSTIFNGSHPHRVVSTYKISGQHDIEMTDDV